MSNFARKIKRKKARQNKKFAQKKLKEVEESITNMPEQCAQCGRGFNQEEADSWTIKISLEEGAIMTCPECQEINSASED